MTANLRAKKSNNTIVWALLALLILSLTGFGVRSVGSGGSQAIGSVGDEEITVDAYVRALNSQLRALSERLGRNITLEQGRALGVDQQVLRQVLVTAAVDGENARIGLSVGDGRVKETLLATEAFQSLSGAFDKNAYEYALQNANLSPRDYDEIIRGQSSRSMLQTSVVAGIQANDTFGVALMSFVGETRNFRWAALSSDLLAEPTRDPTPTEIEALYKAMPETYTTAEKSRITYVHLTPDMLIDSIEADDAALKELYVMRTDIYNIPARRIADRLVFGSTQDAQLALDDITAGTTTFDAVVTARGLTLEDIDLGEVSRDDLTTEAAEALFTLTQPGLVGPVDTDLGPAIFRVNAVLQAQNTSFADARSELHTEYVADRARRQILDSITDIDDLLAGGATLDELAAETDMQLASVDYSAGDATGIAAYQEFRTLAATVKKEDFPEVQSLSDGGIFALQLEEIIDPKLKPLSEVRADVIRDWQTAETAKRLREMAAKVKVDLEAGQTFEALALVPSVETDVRRESFIQTAPSSLVTDVFAMDDRAVAVVEGEGLIAVVQITDISPFNEKAPESAEILTGISAQYSQQIGEDIFVAYTAALQDAAGITINQALIGNVHNQMP